MPQTPDKTERRSPDRSPENDLRKALETLKSARGKFILADNEESGARVLDVIEIVKDMLPEFSVKAEQGGK